MKSTSSLKEIHKLGLYGDYENKKDENLIKILELKNLLIVQIVQYSKSLVSINDIIIDGLKLINEKSKVSYNNDTRILWNGPKNWLLVSTKKDLLNSITKLFKEDDFAVTDLSHSRTIIQLEGTSVKEVLKKGCPFDFDQLKEANCVNSIFNGMAVTIDMIDLDSNKIRIFSLRSFGESFYHSITDSCLEFGFKSI